MARQIFLSRVYDDPSSDGGLRVLVDRDPKRDEIVPHIHTTLGEKARSATGHTSHLLGARVQFLVEMLVVEVLSPTMTRPVNPDLYNVPLLTFGD
jgi:hypothetical protein